MTRLLLDTHTFLWWLAGDEMLSVVVRETIAAEQDSVFVGAASVWEISTKHRLGKLPGASAIAGDLAGAIQSQDFVGRSRFDMGRRPALCLDLIAIPSTAC